MLVDRFFASQKVMAVMHLAGAAILWFVPRRWSRTRRAAYRPVVWLYAVLYADAGADQQYRFHSLNNVDKTFPVVRVFGTIGWIIAGFVLA